MAERQRRRSYAILDISSRLKKAQKIEQLLSSACDLSGAKVLEVGTGSGIIAAHFAKVIGHSGSVHAVDVVDQRQIKNGFSFELVKDTGLPFEDASFDICISNHVIEHVGDTTEQKEHLLEIRRVLRPDGCLYIAVPNRWTIIEPHFKLPLLSWMPEAFRHLYVRWSGRGTCYDCNPPSEKELKLLLISAGYSVKNMSIEGIKIVGHLEFKPGLLQKILQHANLWAWAIRPIIPSFLCIAKPRNHNRN